MPTIMLCAGVYILIRVRQNKHRTIVFQHEAPIHGGGACCFLGARITDGRVYVPVRSLATACSMDVSWNAKTKVCNVTGSYQPMMPTESGYTSEDLYWLSRIIHAESSGEPFKGKIAVGNVVLNRVRRSDYPNTVYDVIFDKKFGTQFTPVASGTIFQTPSEESVKAAKMCLEGYSLNSEMIFFINEKIATNNWITKRTFVMGIGNHKFYK